MEKVRVVWLDSQNMSYFMTFPVFLKLYVVITVIKCLQQSLYTFSNLTNFGLPLLGRYARKLEPAYLIGGWPPENFSVNVVIT